MKQFFSFFFSLGDSCLPSSHRWNVRRGWMCFSTTSCSFLLITKHYLWTGWTILQLVYA